ncbi:MAG: ABC transporter ATP-binding protein/permease [Lachnospiraceae bacterium]|nr:ABC transporter ATP-binding protein/permease [Lachnospiraceae bacterium]
MKELLVYIKEYTKECILGPFFKLLEACFDLAVPLVMASVIDKGIASGDKGYIFKYGGILILLAVIGLTCSITAQFFAAKAATGFAANVRYALFKHIESLSFTEIDGIGTSTMITRMTSDINQLQSGVNMALRLFLRSPFIVFGAAVMAFTIDVKAAIVFVVVIPLLAIVIFGIMLASMPLFKKVQARLDNVMGITRQNLTGVRVIRAFNKEAAEIENFADSNEKLSSMQLFVGRISALANPVTYEMVNIALIALLWTGGIQVDAGNLTQGEIVALVNYMSQILVELVKLANTIVLSTKAVACGGRVQAILAVQSSMEEGDYSGDGSLDTQDAKDRTKGGLDVEFEHASMMYKGAGADSVSDISFKASPGSVTGIIGGTGSGKSTLVNLIPRFYDVSEGCVKVGGRDVKSYKLDTLRQDIGIVLQKSVLFRGTIRDNILWGNPDATDEEVTEALKAAQAWEIVQGKEKGLDYVIEQGGRNLSGGQKQRFAIARALVRKPPVLVFDDSSSALDFATEAKLRKSLQELEYNPTIFIVSQRTSSIQHADNILVLEDGVLAGQGTHEELVNNCEVYKEIYNSQS